jgi:hypothetical protein
MALNKIKVSQLQQVSNIQNFIVFGYDASSGSSAKANMVQLQGNVGPAPNITFQFSAIAYGSSPTVTKTGTTLNPVFTVGFPLAKNGEKPLFQKTGDYIQYKYESDTTWQNLVNLDALRLHFSDLTQAQIEELQAPALDAATNLDNYLQTKETALAGLQNDLNAMLQNATAAINSATTAASDATTAKTEAQAATSAANAAAEAAGNAATGAQNAATSAQTAASEAGAAAEAAIDAKEAAEAATNSVGTAISNAQNAASAANEIASHPPIIQNGTWWMWNLDTHAYADTALPSRGQAGKPPIILPNGHYGYWLDSEGLYVDSGISAEIHTEFETAQVRENITSGNNIPGILGVISKWFADFGPLAWKIPDIDHEPGEDDLTYLGGDSVYPFETGAEVRYMDEDGEITFYKLYGITTENRAVWEEIGGARLDKNVYLQGATYYNESVNLIQEGEMA